MRHRPRPSRPGSGLTSWYQSMLDSRMVGLWLFTHTSGQVDDDMVNRPVLLLTKLEKVNNEAGLSVSQLTLLRFEWGRAELQQEQELEGEAESSCDVNRANPNICCKQ